MVLCFYFHPWEFVEMPATFHYGEGSVTPDPMMLKNCGDYALEQLAAVIDGLAERGASSCSASRLASTWPRISAGYRGAAQR